MAECYIERRFEVKHKRAFILGKVVSARPRMDYRIRSAKRMVEKGIIKEADLEAARQRLIRYKRDQAERFRMTSPRYRIRTRLKEKVLGQKPYWAWADYCCLYILCVAKERLPWVHYIPEPEEKECPRDVLPDLP